MIPEEDYAMNRCREKETFTPSAARMQQGGQAGRPTRERVLFMFIFNPVFSALPDETLVSMVHLNEDRLFKIV